MSKVAAQLQPVIAKIRSLVQNPQQNGTPVFNKPLNTNSCPHHRKSRLLHSVLLILLLAMAITLVTLKAATYDFVEDNRMTGFTFEAPRNSSNTGEAIVMGALPRKLYTVPTKLAIIAAVIPISIATAHLGFVIVDWKSGKRTQSYAFRRNTMFVHLSNAIMVLFALVSIYMTHKNSSTWDAGYVAKVAASKANSTLNKEPVFRYDIGMFDLETWACELKAVPGAAVAHSDYAKQCAVEEAGRAIMIPLVISAWLVAGACIWGFVGGGRRGPDGERVATDEVGVEMGKMNAI